MSVVTEFRYKFTQEAIGVSSEVEVSLIGSQTVVAQLMGLPDKIRTNIEKKAVAEANDVLVGRIRHEAPADSGMLRYSIDAVVRQYQGGRIVIGIIGPRNDFVGDVVVNRKTKRKSFKRKKFKGESYTRRPSKYAHLVEGGTDDRQTKDNKNRGSAPADDFMQRGIDGCRNEIIGIFEKAVKNAIASYE